MEVKNGVSKWPWVGAAIAVLIIVGVWVLNKNSVVTDIDTADIKIGGLFALTGKWEVGGRTEANFAQIAVDEINANGGILGRNIKFIIEDEQCSGTVSVSVFKKLVEQDNVDIILGPRCTPASGPVAPLADQFERVIIAFSTTASGIFDNYKYAYRTSPPADEAGKLIARLVYQKYLKKNVFIINEKTDFGKSWSDQFKDEFISLGGKISANEEYVSGITDFRFIVSKIVSEKPDIIFISSQAPQDAGLIIKQMFDVGVSKDMLIAGNPVLIDTKTVEILGDNFPKNAFTIGPDASNDVLLKKYVDIYKQQPGFQFFYTASAYDMVYLVKEAIESCRNTNSKCIKDYLDKVKFKGQISEWSFNEFGDAIIDRNIYKEIQIIDGNKVHINISSK